MQEARDCILRRAGLQVNLLGYAWSWLINPADASHAHYDGSEVGPWSRWLASRPAKLRLVTHGA
jgi:hypothetical protein